MLVGFRNPFPLFFSSKDELVRVKYWVGRDNPARMSGLKFELWISDGFEWFFIVNILYYPQFAVLARSKQLILMPVTVKFRLDFLVCGLQGRLLWHLAKVGPMFPCIKIHRSNEQLSRLSFRHACLRNQCLLWNLSLHSLPEARGPWERQQAPPALHYACIIPIPSKGF